MIPIRKVVTAEAFRQCVAQAGRLLLGQLGEYSIHRLWRKLSRFASGRCLRYLTSSSSRQPKRLERRQNRSGELAARAPQTAPKPKIHAAAPGSNGDGAGPGPLVTMP